MLSRELASPVISAGDEVLLWEPSGPVVALVTGTERDTAWVLLNGREEPRKAALAQRVGAEESVLEAYDPDQARYPRGHPRAGQWRPKLGTAADQGPLGNVRSTKGWQKRDLADLKKLIDAETMEDIGWTGEGGFENQDRARRADIDNEALIKIGKKVNALAERYTTSGAYKERLARLTVEHQDISGAQWDRYTKVYDAWANKRNELLAEQQERERAYFDVIDDPKELDALKVHMDDAAARVEAHAEDEPDPSGTSYTAAEEKRMREVNAEIVKVREQADRADVDAMRGVLETVRDMGGGKIKLGEVTGKLVDPSAPIAIMSAPQTLSKREATRATQAALTTVAKLLPTDWVKDVEARGTVSVLLSDKRAWHRSETAPSGTPLSQAQEWANVLARRIADQEALGKKYVGGYSDYEGKMFVMSEPDGYAFLVDQEGRTLISPAREKIVPDAPRPRWTNAPLSFVRLGGHGPKVDQQAKKREGVARLVKRGHRFIGREWAAGQPMWPVMEDPSGIRYKLNHAGDPFVTWDTSDGGYAPVTGVIDPSPVPDPPEPDREDSLLRINPTASSTVLHEVAHRIESVYGGEGPLGVPPIARATKAFLARRTADSELRKLRDVTGNTAYKPDEVTREDEFVEPYIGKDYGGQRAVPYGGRPVTEVLTMGLEALFYPRQNRPLVARGNVRVSYNGRPERSDPEMRDLLLGILAAL